MKKSAFIKQLDGAVIEAAIARAEQLTSGEIRVVVAHTSAEAPVPAAQKEFFRLGMQRTTLRNAVLIYVAPESQTFAVIGDEAVHAKCGDAFWSEIAAAMTEHFQAGRFTAGLEHGIARAGESLAAHFPLQSDDTNELPNAVIEH